MTKNEFDIENTLRTTTNSALRGMMWWMRYAMSEKLLSNFWSQRPEVEQLNMEPVHRSFDVERIYTRLPFIFLKKETRKMGTRTFCKMFNVYLILDINIQKNRNKWRENLIMIFIGYRICSLLIIIQMLGELRHMP